jgi:hypothetical protein
LNKQRKGRRNTMAWRPHENLIQGELDNRTPGKVTGWMSFVGLPDRVTFSLEGNFHRDIRGTLIRFRNPTPTDRSPGSMEGFCLEQTGKAGDITAGLPPMDYVGYPYIEWYSENGRVVLELEPSQVEVIGTPIPWETQKPVSREEQSNHLLGWMASLGVSIAASTEGSSSDRSVSTVEEE